LRFLKEQVHINFSNDVNEVWSASTDLFFTAVDESQKGERRKIAGPLGF